MKNGIFVIYDHLNHSTNQSLMKPISKKTSEECLLLSKALVDLTDNHVFLVCMMSFDAINLIRLILVPKMASDRYNEIFAVIVRPNSGNDLNEKFIVNDICKGKIFDWPITESQLLRQLRSHLWQASKLDCEIWSFNSNGFKRPNPAWTTLIIIIFIR